MANISLTNVKPGTSPPGAAVSLSNFPGSANDTETVNYTGAVVSPPTGWTVYSSNATIAATNLASEPTTISIKGGWISAVSGAADFSANNRLPITSVAAGTWQFGISFGGTGLLGPTVKIGTRLWQVSADLTTATAISTWAYTGNVTAAGTYNTSHTPGVVTFNSVSPYLYVEVSVDVVTGGSNIVANPLTVNSINGNLPAIGYSRAPAESMTAASDAATRVTTYARAVLEGTAYGTTGVTGFDFDGTTNYFRKGAAFSGIASGKQGTFACWLRLDGGNATQLDIFRSATTLEGAVARFLVFRNSSNKIAIAGFNSANTKILDLTTTNSYTSGATLLNVLISWDLAAGVSNLYINDVSDKTTTTVTNDVIDYSGLDWAVGAGPDGNRKFNGCMYEVFFHTSYIDFSVTANRRKFIDASLNQVALGYYGETPFATPPIFYNPVANAVRNRGSGGDFTQQFGSFSNASTAPGGSRSNLGGGAVDVVTRIYTANRPIAESTSTPSDAVTRQTSGQRTVSESLTALNDAVSRRTDVNRGIAESVAAASDAVTRVYNANRVVAQSVAAANDVVTRIAQFNRPLSESVAAATDAVARQTDIKRTIAESAPAANDAVTRAVQANRTVNENVGASGGSNTYARSRVVNT